MIKSKSYVQNIFMGLKIRTKGGRPKATFAPNITGTIIVSGP